MSTKGKQSKGSPYKYHALAYRQCGTRGPRFLIFHAPADDIKTWADVDRMSPRNPTGAQRPLRELKYKKITRFFSAGTENTIPTAIVVALDENAVSFSGSADPARSAPQHGVLTITPKGTRKPGLIIDGQHRVYGAADAADGIQLNVVALLGANDTERAFQFVVINNSANRVSVDHIKALNLSYDLVSNFYGAVAAVFEDAWKNHTPKTSRLVHGTGIAAMGYVMEAIYSRTGKFDRATFVSGLQPLVGKTAWTDGVWNFGKSEIVPWDRLQNVGRDVVTLAHHLVAKMRPVKNAKRKKGKRSRRA